MNSIKEYLEELARDKVRDSSKTFRFTVTIGEDYRQRLDYVSELLDVPRAVFASELLTMALYETEIQLGLMPAAGIKPADWTEKNVEYVKEHSPVLYYSYLLEKGEMNQEEFFRNVKLNSDGTFVLREGAAD